MRSSPAQGSKCSALSYQTVPLHLYNSGSQQESEAHRKSTKRLARRYEARRPLTTLLLSFTEAVNGSPFP